MINRLRRAWRDRAALLTVLLRAGSTLLDKDDVFMLLGVALVAGGVSVWSRALALIIPGVVLLWAFLPSRPPFIDTPTTRGARRPLV